MDPALKDYLDKLHQDSKADTAAVLKRLDEQATQLRAQTQQIDDLLHWKPDLEAPFAQLEQSVFPSTVVPDVFSATTQAQEAPTAAHDASSVFIEMAPVTCSTECQTQVAAIAKVNVTSVATTTEVDPKTSVQELDDSPLSPINSTQVVSEANHIVVLLVPSNLAAPVPSKCLAECSMYPPSFEHQPWPPPVQVQIRAQGSRSRPCPWPLFDRFHEGSLRCHQGVHLELLCSSFSSICQAVQLWSDLPTAEFQFSAHGPTDPNLMRESWWCLQKITYKGSHMEEPFCCLPVAKLQSGRPPDRATTGNIIHMPPVRVRISHMGHLFRPRPWPSFKYHSNDGYPAESCSGIHNQPHEVSLFSSGLLVFLFRDVASLQVCCYVLFSMEEPFSCFLGAQLLSGCPSDRPPSDIKGLTELELLYIYTWSDHLVSFAAALPVPTKACNLQLGNIRLNSHIIQGEMNSKILQQSGIQCVQPTTSVCASMKLDESSVAVVCMFKQGTPQDWELMLCFKERPPLVYIPQVHWKPPETVACWIPMVPSYIPVLSQTIIQFMDDLTLSAAEWRVAIFFVHSSYACHAQDTQSMFEFSPKNAQLKLPGSYFFCNCQVAQFTAKLQQTIQIMSMLVQWSFFSLEEFQGSGCFARECRFEQLDDDSRARIQLAVLTNFHYCSFTIRPCCILLIRPLTEKRTSEDKNSLVHALFTDAHAHGFWVAGYMVYQCTLSKIMRSQSVTIQSFELCATFLSVQMDPLISTEAWEQCGWQHLISAGTYHLLSDCRFEQRIPHDWDWLLFSNQRTTRAYLKIGNSGPASLCILAILVEDSVHHWVVPIYAGIQEGGDLSKYKWSAQYFLDKWIYEPGCNPNSQLSSYVYDADTCMPELMQLPNEGYHGYTIPKDLNFLSPKNDSKGLLPTARPNQVKFSVLAMESNGCLAQLRESGYNGYRFFAWVQFEYRFTISVDVRKCGTGTTKMGMTWDPGGLNFADMQNFKTRVLLPGSLMAPYICSNCFYKTQAYRNLRLTGTGLRASRLLRRRGCQRPNSYQRQPKQQAHQLMGQAWLGAHRRSTDYKYPDLSWRTTIRAWIRHMAAGSVSSHLWLSSPIPTSCCNLYPQISYPSL